MISILIYFSMFACMTCHSLFDYLNPETHDYCLHEYFNATCVKGHVLLMTSAQYGRMRAGRCANSDYSMGCSVDVLVRFNRLCGGKGSCLVPVRSLLDLHPCQKDYMSYLQASHVCLQVDSFYEYNSCRGGRSLNLNDLKQKQHETPTPYHLLLPPQMTSGVFTILLESRTKSSRSMQRLQSTTLLPEARSRTSYPSNIQHKFDKETSEASVNGNILCWWQVMVDAGFQTIEVLVLPFSNHSTVASLSFPIGLSLSGVQSNTNEVNLPQIGFNRRRYQHSNEITRNSSMHNNNINNYNISTTCATTRYFEDLLIDDDLQLNNNNNNMREILEICLNERNPSVRRFETTTNELLIVLPQQQHQQQQQLSSTSRLLISFRANGCQGIEAGPGFWHEKVGNTLNMKCTDTLLSANLTCVGDVWMGEVLNCSRNDNSTFLSNTDTTTKHHTTGTFNFSQSSVLVAVFFGAGFGVMLGLTLLVSLYCARRRFIIHKRERGELLVCGGPSQGSCCFSTSKRSGTTRLQATGSTGCTPASDREVIMFLGQADVLTNPDPVDSPMCHVKSRESRMCDCCEMKLDNHHHQHSNHPDKCCSDDLPEILYDHRGPRWKVGRGSRTYYAPLVSSLSSQSGNRKHQHVNPCEEAWDPIEEKDQGHTRRNSSLLESDMESDQIMLRCSNCTRISKHFHSLNKSRSKNLPVLGHLQRTSSTTTFSNFSDQLRETDEWRPSGEWNNNSASGGRSGGGLFQDMCVECLEKYLKQRKQCEVSLFVKPLEIRNIV